MFSKYKNLIVFLCTILFLFSVGVVFAQVPTTYVPLSPIKDTTVSLTDPSKYFSNLFIAFVAITAILGVIKLMLCGFQYMTSEAISTKAEAKKCIWFAIGGLFLILLSVLILQTINKDLIKIPFNTIRSNILKAAPQTAPPGSIILPNHQCYINTISGQVHEFVNNAECIKALKAARAATAKTGSLGGIGVGTNCTPSNCAIIVL